MVASRLDPELLASIAAEDARLSALPLSRRPGSGALRPRGPMPAAHRAAISAARREAERERRLQGLSRSLSAEHRAAIARSMRWTFDNTDHAAKISAGARGRSKARRTGVVCTCSHCGQAGHNTRTCAVLRQLVEDAGGGSS